MDAQQQEKFRRMVQYIASKGRSDERLSVTKLNKLLYYADFTAYRELGRSISGLDYEHLTEGPVPENMHRLRDEMVYNSTIYVEEVDYRGFKQQRVFAYHQPNMAMFSDDERAILDRIIARFWDFTATQISEHSHQEPGWRLTTPGEKIPYRTAWLAPTKLTESQIQVGKEIASRHGLLDSTSL